MTDYCYQIGFAGQPEGFDEMIKSLFIERMDELGVLSDKLTFYDEVRIGDRDRKLPFCLVFFGYEGAEDSNHLILKELRKDSVFVIPVVEKLEDFSTQIPESLRDINGTKIGDCERIVSVVLEHLRLLRSERRLFISYKRNESRSIAIQLYETLESAGFDVFLDTHSVPSGKEFQEVLWHRLADSDIMVLLDTPKFRNSYWTKEELAKANSTNIQILHVLWPTVTEDEESAFSEFMKLDKKSFIESKAQIGDSAKLIFSTAEEVSNSVERLRARAVAARYRDLVDNFLDNAESLNLSANMQPERFISLKIKDNENVAVFPALGVPSAQTYEQIEIKVSNSGSNISSTWVLYDERGVSREWLEHLSWLNSYLPLTSVKASEAIDIMQREKK
jgi:hypothetical protein